MQPKLSEPACLFNEAGAPASATGGVIHLASPKGGGLSHFLYVPSSIKPDSPLLIVVHGISENAWEHAEGFAPLAEENGLILIAPLFTGPSYRDYQRLGRANRGTRADLALQDLIHRTANTLNLQSDKILLFGFSGGAQFVHRYAMAYPEQVIAYAVGAAGWYTFPDPRIRYPRGIGFSPDLPLSFDPHRFLRVPAAVFVGERDIHQGYSLNKSPKITAQQGPHRLERANRWIQAMRAGAREHELETAFDLFTLPRCNHKFRKNMRRGKLGTLVVQWLLKHQAHQRPA